LNSGFAWSAVDDEFGGVGWVVGEDGDTDGVACVDSGVGVEEWVVRGNCMKGHLRARRETRV
jgi:hypothetical protein